MPLKNIEIISVFYKKLPLYNPQFTIGKPNNNPDGYIRKSEGANNIYGKFKNTPKKRTNKKYPKQVLRFKQQNPNKIMHPTQKPVLLLEYLIKTYTNKGDVVLDFTMGSGTTGVACKKLERDFIGIELDETYYKIARERLEAIEGSL